jgi:hypothetical protein
MNITLGFKRQAGIKQEVMKVGRMGTLSFQLEP